MKTKPIVSQTTLLLLTLFLAGWTVPSLQAQAPSFDWANLLTSDPQPHDSVDTASDPEGNVIIAYRVYDTTATSITNSRTWDDNVVIKLDAGGNILWSLAVLPNIQKLVTDASGNVYVAGSLLRGHPYKPLMPDDYFSTRNISTEGTGSAYVARISSGGVLEWVRRDGGAAVVDANAVAVAADGSYYAAGFYIRGSAQIGSTVLPAPATTNARNVFVAKYATNGTVQWVRVGETRSEQTGGVGIAVDRSGSLFLGCRSLGDLSFGAGADALTGLILAKFDRLGGLLWAHDDPASDGGRSVAVDNDGNAFLAYRSASSPLVLAKYGPAGDLLWRRQPQVNSDSAIYMGIAVDSQGNCIAGGGFTFTSPPPDYPILPGDISFDSYAVTNVASLVELFVVKYTGSGEVRWAMQTVGLDPMENVRPPRVSDTRMSSIALAPGGGIFISGAMRGTVEFGATTLVGLDWQAGGLGIFATRITDPSAVAVELKIVRTASGVALSWPVGATNYVLEVATSLSAVSWNAVTNNPTVGATERSVQLPLTGNAKFFRLRKP